MGDSTEDRDALLPEHTMNDEEQSDTDKKYDEKSSPSGIQIRQPGRLIVVEPLVVFMAGSFYPLMLASNLYNYGWFEHKVAHETGFNLSDLTINDTAICTADTTSPAYIFIQKVQSRNAYFNMCTTLAAAVPSIFATLLLSPYSDKAGRRYSIIPPVIAGFAYAVVLFIVVMFKLPVWYTLIGSFLEGLGGGYGLLFVGIYSYIADTTSLKSRRFRITLVDIIMMATATTGPIAFGYWIRHSGYLWPCLFTVAMRLLNIIYAVFFVPETVISTEKPKFMTVSHVITGVNVFKQNTNGRRWQLLCLLAAYLCCYVAYQEYTIDTLFELNEPLCWGPVIMGYYSTVYMAVSAIGGTIVAWMMRYCATDLTVGIVAGVMAMAHYIYKGFITRTYELFLTSGFAMFSVLYIPSIRTLMSKLVSSSEQGAVFGAVALFGIIFGTMGGLLFNAVYANTLWISPGFVFIVAGLFYAVGTSILVGYALRLRCTRSQYAELEVFDEETQTSQSPRQGVVN